MIRAFLITLMLVNLIGCASRKTSENRSALVENIRNSDIRWGGNIVGLDPHVSGVSKQILDDPKPHFADLIKALKDEQRFVAAHVLLSMRSGPFKLSAEQFNGLWVELLANGTVVIPPNQQANLIEKWNEWLKAKAENP